MQKKRLIYRGTMMLKVLKEIDDRGEVRSRSGVMALMLSICPGLGQQYAGYITRGIVLYISLIIISWLAAAVFMFIEGRAAVALFLVPVGGFLFTAFDAYRLASRQAKDYKLRWFNRWWIYPTVFILLLLTVNPLMDALIGKTITRGHLAHTDSMLPTVLNNDILLVNKLAYKISAPQRGDIVLIDFNLKRVPGLTKIAMDDQLVRRIIAVPGDTVEIKGLDVMVNGKKIEELYVSFKESNRPLYVENSFGPATVPPDAYFIMGDNRNFSIDSRILGFIDKRALGGKITKILWSWNLNEEKIKWDRAGMNIR